MKTLNGTTIPEADPVRDKPIGWSIDHLSRIARLERDHSAMELAGMVMRLRRDNARLRKELRASEALSSLRMMACETEEVKARNPEAWMRRWLTTAPIALGLNLATKRLRSEINSALKGDAPPKGGKR